MLVIDEFQLVLVYVDKHEVQELEDFKKMFLSLISKKLLLGQGLKTYI